MKKVLIVLGIIVGVVILGAVIFMMRFQQMQKYVVENYLRVTNIDMTQVADGVYNGKAGDFVCTVNLDVIVKDHQIGAVIIKDQMSGGPKYEARDMTNKIVQAQSPKTDVVTGASGSSKIIMIAVYDALTKK
ncbi:MAG: hypothetical protein HPY53_07675 [Brevinematales bacterium]|nr:hypothetical protein [Brevinematales bacterium]